MTAITQFTSRQISV